MAALDIQGFVTPEQQFAGLYKAADSLATQQAARQKEKASQDVNKKLLNTLVENIDPKDFMTLTMEDGVISNKIYNAKQKLSNYISQNPNIDQNQLNNLIASEIKGIAASSQNIKSYKQMADETWKGLEKNPSADKTKFYKEFNKIFLNPDGTVREDIDKILPNADYANNLLANGDIWTASGVEEYLKDINKSKNTYKVTVQNPDKSMRKTSIDYTAPGYMQPVIVNGVYQGYSEPKHDIAMENGVAKQVQKVDALGSPMVDAKGNPIMEEQRLLTENDFKDVIANEKLGNYIKQEMRKYATSKNLPITDIDVINQGKNVAYKLLDRQSGVTHEEVKETKAAPNVTNVRVTTGGSGGASTTVRDIHNPAATIYNNLKDLKNKALDLVSQGKTDKEIGAALGLDKTSTLIKNARKGIKTVLMPLNTKGLDNEFVKSVITNLNSIRKKPGGDEFTASDVYVELNDNNQWEVKSHEDGTLLTTIDPITLGFAAQPGQKPKVALVNQYQSPGNKTTKTKKDPLGIFP